MTQSAKVHFQMANSNVNAVCVLGSRVRANNNLLLFSFFLLYRLIIIIYTWNAYKTNKWINKKKLKINNAANQQGKTVTCVCVCARALTHVTRQKSRKHSQNAKKMRRQERARIINCVAANACTSPSRQWRTERNQFWSKISHRAQWMQWTNTYAEFETSWLHSYASIAHVFVAIVCLCRMKDEKWRLFCRRWKLNFNICWIIIKLHSFRCNVHIFVSHIPFRRRIIT